MNSSALTLTHRSLRDADLRRSRRIEQPVALLVLRANRRGEFFQEKTSAVSVNLHGCRYVTHHDYRPEGWVTLQVTGTDCNKSPIVRARVRSVHAPQTPGELCQVGIELETPGNIWGIAPPEDWQLALGIVNTDGGSAATAIPALNPSTPASSFPGNESAAPERKSEVTVFPDLPTPAAQTSLGDESAAPERESEVTVFPDLPTPAAQTSLGNESAAPERESEVTVFPDLPTPAAQTSPGNESAAPERESEVTMFPDLPTPAAQTSPGNESAAPERESEVTMFPDLPTPAAQTSPGNESAAPERESEVTMFPDLPTPAAQTSLVAPTKDSAAIKASRVVITADQLLQALQGRIQLAADKAVQISLSRQFDQALKNAIAKVEDGWRAHVRQTEEFSAARLDKVQNQWEKGLMVYHTRAQEISHHLEALAVKSQQTLAETQKFAECFANETAPQIDARLNDSLSRANTELEARAAQVSGQHLAQLAESAQLAVREARSQLSESIAQLHSLLSSANGVVSLERVESLIHSSSEQTLRRLDERLGELYIGFEQQHNLTRHRTEEIASQLESLATETCRARAQYEHALSEIRSDLADTKAGVPQERVNSLLSSSRERLLGRLQEFRRLLDVQVDHFFTDAKESVASSLASLDVESHAGVEAADSSVEPMPED
jgi:hypothetical protein